MNLAEKIYYCRRKCGKSQEALAEQLGVSRQAVSKWENGDAEPETNKLRPLAEAFGVTVDWLLSDEEPVEDVPKEEAPSREQAGPSQNWVESIPGVLGKLIRRYGWLYGVYLAIAGAGFAFIGWLARFISNQMLADFSDPFGGVYWEGGELPGGEVIWDMGPQTLFNAQPTNPVAIFGSFIMVIGIIMIIAGVVLAVVLKRQNKD